MLPETLEGAFWENKYIGWFAPGAPVSGFVFDFQRPEHGLVYLGERLSGLYVDPQTDELYGTQGRNIMEWDKSDSRLIGQWVSKLFDLDDDAVMGWAEIESDAYTNTTFTLSAGRLPTLGVVDSFQVQDDEPERLACVRDDKFQLSVRGQDKTRRLKVVEHTGEL